MKKIKVITLSLSCAAVLAGCEGLSRSLGLTHDQPDEFLVQRNKPLSIPPNYKLVEPLSKQERKAESENKAKALLGYSSNSSKSGASESSLLAAASNGHKTDSQIRKKVDEDASLTENIPPKLVKAVESWKRQWKKNCNSKET